MTTPDDRTARIARAVAETLRAPFAVSLWTGERIGPAEGPTVKINGPDAVTRLVRRPSLDTAVELWAEKTIDIEGGTIFDIAGLRPEGGLKSRLKALPRWRLARDLPSVYFGSSAAGGPSGLAGQDRFTSGSAKEAIRHHYDVSNDFYRLFLDERMVYSCGYFTGWDNGIDQAQFDKLELICRKLRLKPGERFLDIGCGWGALLIHAAKHHGVVAHGVSLSEAQTALARERIAAEGLEDRITIEVKPYQDLEGPFDKIASIGMFEHVGFANYDSYFAKVRDLLVPGGIYLHHAITRRMKRSRRAFGRKSAEHKALVKYIFPGGELDHIGMTLQNLEAHGFEVHDVENLREHYGRTCRLWTDRLQAREAEAIAEIGEPRTRLWLLYLAGCALAFERGTVQINQTVATRRRKRGPSGLPPTRADLYR
ncbi:SAM-dependent methyltransferase [Lutibaculum baratangense]|uniref:Cyclopropane-fatty-acyl-phospholipid synthase n=1 Tax=Lutibaculum baratangense AMV1 TaxID=631454 RepID=V4RQV1_9HYPH|nr:cyclopropane-fatty-acyl-phospholipid synthase family protein [Lutibaculum baratangense]ESR25515.1 Cyclopropane-fatty-acyl-phospholipid synthase [Lutibaculum baratangense AMV1]